MVTGYRQAGFWRNERGANMSDGGAPYYTVYETEDGKFMAAGAIEKRFYAEMVQRLGLDAAGLPDRDDRANWESLRAIFAARFRARS